MTLNIICTLVLILTATTRGIAGLPKPQNVKINSMNLRSVLLWDPVSSKATSYDVEYKDISVDQWSIIKECESTDKTECDFTDSIRHYDRVTLRVRARSGSNTSAWVETKQFYPLRDTDLGPPIVKLEVEAGVLYVSISDPLENSTNQSLKFYYRQLKYQVTYWKKHEKRTELDPSPNTSVKLEELEPGAMYCVEVKTVEDYYHNNKKVGKPSKVDCKYIYDNDPTKVVVFVVLSAVVISLFVIGCFFLVRYTPGYIKDLLHPAWNVPEHIAEFLSRSSEGLNVRCISEEKFDTVSVLLDDSSRNTSSVQSYEQSNINDLNSLRC
ncbi:interferon alpha/beta receptor 1a-like isoform X2 [Acipenser ruthenus]|uniref:interferon alpha/beta receptor 1a-like isoform X2 n=1 Tax=Acipenser ruthenus TaxID=7906 RepID=UPI00145C02D8|nr:interferon alpha/beta receptor 1a-like isoform X2 [Acipenser ruthenus]